MNRYAELTDDHVMFQKVVRDFAQQVIAPRAAEIDRTDEFPHWAVKAMAEQGLMGICYPEEYEGAGGDTLMYAIAMEEIARASGSVALTLAAHVSLGIGPIFSAAIMRSSPSYALSPSRQPQAKCRSLSLPLDLSL